MGEKSALIAQQNDEFRSSLGRVSIPGTVVMTAGIAALSRAQQTAIMQAVAGFASFSEENDPYGEHDFGSIDLANVGKVMWKIDYYAPDLVYGSEDPSDLEQTHRVLTIMLASEY